MAANHAVRFVSACHEGHRKCHGNSWSAKRVVRATGSLGVAEDRKSEWSGLDAGSVEVPKISGDVC